MLLKFFHAEGFGQQDDMWMSLDEVQGGLMGLASGKQDGHGGKHDTKTWQSSSAPQSRHVHAQDDGIGLESSFELSQGLLAVGGCDNAVAHGFLQDLLGYPVARVFHPDFNPIAIHVPGSESQSTILRHDIHGIDTEVHDGVGQGIGISKDGP